ncbi:MAG: hypothetical protein AAF004_14810 [Pseudomonadota bacterium]
MILRVLRRLYANGLILMPDDKALEGTQKAAILLMTLGEEEASSVLKHMSPKEVQSVGLAIVPKRAVLRGDSSCFIHAYDSL